MIDNRMTELREKLTERGVEYRTTEVHGMPVTLYDSGGRTWSVTGHPNGYMVVNCGNLTPEQAIAATLGSGTLTAEQVRKAIKELLEELVAKVENDANWRCNASDEIDCMTARIREAVKRDN